VVCLEGSERTISDLKNTFLKMSFDWVSASGCLSCENFLDFLDLHSFLGVIGILHLVLSPLCIVVA
jgi:hypothetical protein